MSNSISGDGRGRELQNPAKRAAEERAARERGSGVGALGGGAAFGGQDLPDLANLDPSQLPAGFEKFLGGGKS